MAFDKLRHYLRFQRKPCPDCEPAQVNHLLRRWSVYIDVTLERAFRPLGRIADEAERIAAPFFDTVAWWLMRGLTAIGLAQFLSQPDTKTPWRARCVWETAEKRGMKMRELRPFFVPIDTYVLYHGDRRMIFKGLPQPSQHMHNVPDWDDKGVMHTHLDTAGIPIARGGSVRTYESAIALFYSLSKPVVLKPSRGSRSRHTTSSVGSENDFHKAFWKAKQLSPWIIIEEELKGGVYRVTIVGNKVVGIIRRDPPHVVGDGVLNVRELIEKENKNPKRLGPIFHAMVVDKDAERELARQSFTPESIPAHGLAVALSQKISRGIGGTTADVTDGAHPQNLALFEKMIPILREPIVGIDFIIGDMRIPWMEQERCGVIECNCLPFIDLHHYPFVGTSRDVAGSLFDLIFPKSAETMED